MRAQRAHTSLKVITHWTGQEEGLLNAGHEAPAYTVPLPCSRCSSCMHRFLCPTVQTAWVGKIGSLVHWAASAAEEPKNTKKELNLEAKQRQLQI